MIRVFDAIDHQNKQKGEETSGKKAAAINEHVTQLAGAASIEALDGFVRKGDSQQKQKERQKTVMKQWRHVTGDINQNAKAGKLGEVRQLADIVMKQRKVDGSDTEPLQVARNKDSNLVTEGARGAGNHG